MSSNPKLPRYLMQFMTATYYVDFKYDYIFYTHNFIYAIAAHDTKA